MGNFVSSQRSPQRGRSWHLVGISTATLSLAILLLLDVGLASSSTSVASNEPTTIILDDFERGLEDPLQQWGNWASSSIDGSGATMESFGGTAGHNEGDVHGDSYRVADIPAGDGEAYGTIAVNPGDQRWMYLYINLQDVGSPGFDGYELRWFHWISGDGLYLRKIVDGVSTNLPGSPVQMSNTDEPRAGDRLLLRRAGSALQVWHKKAATGEWILRLSATDSQFQGGKIGFGSDESKARWADFGGTGTTTPEPPPPALPATGVLDAFERADEDPLSQNGAWSSTPVGGAGQTLEVLGFRAGQNEGEVVQANSFRPSDTAGDAEAYGTVGAFPDNNQWFYLYLHLQQAGTAGWDGYRAAWFHWIQTDGLYIQKITDGVATTLVGPIALDPQNGDTLLLRRVGEALELWRKNAGAWTKLLTAADPEYTHGMLGLGLDDDDGKWDDFGGGAPSGSPPPPPPPPSTDPPAEQSNGICTGSGVHAHSTSRCLSDPVNTLTGAFITQTEDLATAGTGVSFSWSRSYTSSDPTVGRLGPGWTDNYATSLVEHPTGNVTLRGDEGQEVVYTQRVDGSFVGAPGALSKLSSVAGGYELVRVDQVVYGFDSQGRLTSIEDRNGQGLSFGYDGQGRLTRVTDAANRDTTVTHDASGLVSQVETADGRRVAYGYTGGRLTSVTDVRGNKWTYSYDSAGRLASIVDPLQHIRVSNVYDVDGHIRIQTDGVGKTTSFAWDADTEVASVTDANGKIWKHDYDGGVLAKQVDPLNHVTVFAFDSDLNPSGVTSPTQDTTTMTYDATGNLLSATAPTSLGSVQKTFDYNQRNDPVRITDGAGSVTSYMYEASGNTTGVIQDGRQVASYTYDAAGRVVTSTDGNAKTTTYVYDADGNVASVRDPVGNKTTYTYDDAGRVLTRVDPNGNHPGSTPSDFTWTWAYNAAGQVLKEQDPLGNATSYVYDEAGNELATTDAKGRTTSYSYDDANRVISETRPDPDAGGPLEAPETTYTYDDVGNELSATDPLGRTTRFAYDSANRLVSTTGPDPDGTGPMVEPTTSRTYDPNGNLASVVEPRGNAQGANPDDYRTRYTYDAAGRLLTTTDPLGQETSNTYDEVGNLDSARDANGHTTAYGYDGEGRLVTVIAPDGGTTAYTYDGAGNRLTRRDASNHVTTYAYDGAGHLVSEVGPDPDGSGPKSSAVTSHGYDANGNLFTTVDPNGNATSALDDGKTSFGYDRANRLISIDYSDSTPDVAFAYDPVGNRVQMTDGAGSEARAFDGLDRLVSVTRGSANFSFAYNAVGNITRRVYPGGRATDYGYDGLDRLSTVTSDGRSVGYGYDVASNLVQTTLPADNGHVETRRYDRSGRLTEVASRKGVTTLAGFAMTLDPVGNPTQAIRTGTLAQIQSYAYDASDRIVSVCFQAGTCPGPSDPFIRWTYDQVGNRVTETRPGGTTSYTYDAADRLLAAGSTSYTYDQNGNEVSAGRRTSTYDLANRMKTTKVGATTTTYSYDGDGIRLQASTGGKTSQKTNFLWDVAQALPQIAIEQNGSGSVLRSYTYGARRLSMTSGSVTSYYHYEGLGSVANVTSPSGAIRWTYAYEPFGTILTEQRSGGNPPTNAMKFAGEYLDATGLYHLRARQYDPTIGRFLSPDPVDPASSSSHLSGYSYTGNRPTVMVDPTGETYRPANDGLEFVRFVVSPVAGNTPYVRCQALLCGPRLTTTRALVYPIPEGRSNFAGAVHPTSGLPGYKAIDFLARGGTPVLAVQTGEVRRHSGRNPALGVAGGSVFGWSLYLRADSGSDFFYTHLGKRTAREKERVRAGQIIGEIGHWPGDPGRSHVHVGVSGGAVTIEMVRRAPRVRLRG